MSWFVYILRCVDDLLYVGRTRNYKKRLIKHDQGEGSKFTKNRRPVKLVYLEKYQTLNKAFKREFQIKGWSREKKENLIKYGKPVLNTEKGSS